MDIGSLRLAVPIVSVLVMIALGTIGIVIGWKAREECGQKSVVVGLLVAVASLIGAAPLTHTVVTVATADQEGSVVTSSTPLIAMASATEVQGNVFAMQEGDVFRYVIQGDDGAYSLEKIDAEDVLIMEDATTESARLDVTTCRRTGLPDRYERFKTCGPRTETLHVPKGTVSNRFTVSVAG